MAPFFIGKDIAINCWNEIPNLKDYVHFYTHVNINSASVPVGLFAKIRPIYTSSFLAWYLLTYLGAHKDAFKTIEFGIEHTLFKNGREITFEFVTSNSLQPYFMILFKNEMGDELFAGNCKFTMETLSIRSILPYLSSKSLTNFYFDGSYMNTPRLPSTDQIIHSVINTIKVHKRKIVYISANILGNENILCIIAQAVNKKIHVSTDKFAILGKLGLSKYFTTEPSTTYIRTIDYSQISIKKVSARNKLLGPSVTIVLSLKAFFANEEHKEDFMKNGIFFFPLTSLNTPSELQFIKQIRTKDYVFTNHMTPISNGSSDITADCTTKNDKPYRYNHFNLRRYSKFKTYDGKLKKELTKCEPDYWLSWTDYLKWRQRNCYHSL
uniref:5' exonuclease Apollo n=3 Tax=Lygus hesperus TaxID=30085 RepID=A0A0A9X0T0_LYGHE